MFEQASGICRRDGGDVFERSAAKFREPIRNIRRHKGFIPFQLTAVRRRNHVGGIGFQEQFVVRDLGGGGPKRGEFFVPIGDRTGKTDVKTESDAFANHVDIAAEGMEQSEQAFGCGQPWSRFPAQDRQ